jgi:integrase
MVFLDMPAGLRRGELAGLKWEDVDFKRLHLNVNRSLVDQHVGPVKTEVSRKLMPIDEYVARELVAWYEQTPYKQLRRDRLPTPTAPGLSGASSRFG